MRNRYASERGVVAAFALALMVLVLPGIGHGSCNTTTCSSLTAGGSGDIDGDGFVSGSDLVYLIDYCFNGGPAPASLCNAEINGICNKWFDCEPTIGDIAELINYMFQGGSLTSCGGAVGITVGPLTVNGYNLSVTTTASATKTMTFVANNTSGTSQMLYGYTLPIEVVGSGVTINSIAVLSQYKGPGDVWTPSATNTTGNRVFGYAVPDAGLTPVVIPSGGSQQILKISVNYSCPGPTGSITTATYTASPAEVPSFVTGGTLAPGRLAGVSLEETEFAMERPYAEVATMPASGRGILAALILACGIVVGGELWRRASGHRSP